MRSVSCVQLFAISWTIVCQASLPMEFSRQKYWSRLPFSPPGDLPNPGIEPGSLESSALAREFFTTEPPGKPLTHHKIHCFSNCTIQWFLAYSQCRAIINTICSRTSSSPQRETQYPLSKYSLFPLSPSPGNH